MFIKSKIIRMGGTQLGMNDLNGKPIHFKPNAVGDHVAFIQDAKIRHRLTVQIPEGYEVYHDQTIPAVAAAAAGVGAALAGMLDPNAVAAAPAPAPVDRSPAPGSVLEVQQRIKGSGVHPDEIDFDRGGKVSIDTIVAFTFQESKMKLIDWNELEYEERAVMIDKTIARLYEFANPKDTKLETKPLSPAAIFPALGEPSAPAPAAPGSSIMQYNDDPATAVGSQAQHPVLEAAGYASPASSVSAAAQEQVQQTANALAPELKAGAGEGPLAGTLTKAEKEARRVKPTSMIISNGPEKIDLLPMERAELVVLAESKFGMSIHKKWPAQTIRDKIIEATRAAAQ